MRATILGSCSLSALYRQLVSVVRILATNCLLIPETTNIAGVIVLNCLSEQKSALLGCRVSTEVYGGRYLFG